MRSIGFIPVRMGSTRFPGKPLVDIKGKPMIQWVYEAARKSNLDVVMFVSNDKEIYDAALKIGAVTYMTDACNSGTERIIKAIEKISGFEYIVNIQGDEPMIDPEDINSILLNAKEGYVSTLVSRLTDRERLDRNTVKAHLNENEINCFTRSPIYDSDNTFFKHVGIYGYHSNLLKKISEFEPSENEKAESLEQLRWMDNGVNIRASFTNNNYGGIDTPEDLETLLNQI